jgi:hypothetical protein
MMFDKRYLVFMYDKHYPSGGLGDFKESFDTYNEAYEFVKDKRSHYEISEIYDRIEGTEVDIPPYR